MTNNYYYYYRFVYHGKDIAQLSRTGFVYAISTCTCNSVAYPVNIGRNIFRNINR